MKMSRFIRIMMMVVVMATMFAFPAYAAHAAEVNHGVETVVAEDGSIALISTTGPMFEETEATTTATVLSIPEQAVIHNAILEEGGIVRHQFLTEKSELNITVYTGHGDPNMERFFKAVQDRPELVDKLNGMKFGCALLKNGAKTMFPEDNDSFGNIYLGTRRHTLADVISELEEYQPKAINQPAAVN